MTTEAMRERISNVYGGPVWKWRVSEMPDNQIYAIYRSMEREGRFNPKPKMKETERCEQLDIFSILKNKEQNHDAG